MLSPKETTSEAAVLRANASFYRAFTHADYAAMCQLWAQHAPVACLHPGASMLVGRGPVLDAWRQIMTGPEPLVMRCDHPNVHMLGDCAIVTCHEGNAEHPAHLIATNVFVLEDGHWRMVHHQAGPLARVVPRPAPVAASN
jgi:ketosteroid isomerase-like protein